MNRTIIIGDIHGCISELTDLLKKISFNSNSDVIYSVGDFINRGPDSPGVFSKLKEINCRMILGNHEYYVKQQVQRKNISVINEYRKTFGSVFNDFINFLFKTPLYIETNKFIIVHAGIDPYQQLSNQNAETLTTIRTLDSKPVQNTDYNGKPWFNSYKSEKLIVFGHWAQLGCIIRDNVIGLDTGCVYGKKLTALILPERKLVSVKAKQIYEVIP